MIDVNLLRLMRYRKDCHLLTPMVKEPVLSKEVIAIAKDFNRYFEEYPKDQHIDLIRFLPRFQMWHPGMAQERLTQFNAILRTIFKEDATATDRDNIVRELSEIELMTKLGNAAEEFNNGDLPNAGAEISRLFDEYRIRTNFKSLSHIDTPIEELLKDEFNDAGLKWRLDCLNAGMRGLRAGDFGIVAGRPDKGKTSFIADNAAAWASQIPEGRNIIWLNNEGKGERIIPRIWQAALNMTMDEMKEASNAGTLRSRYSAAMGGRPDAIRVFDIHGYNNAQVEIIIEANNPAVIIYDMIDNIRGFGDASRTDLQLEQMYQWARERSVKYDCIGIATSQISNDGDGLQYPTLGMLKDSKTGKQGACDFQLMIGAANDPNLANSRFISLPKNKLRKPSGKSDPRCEVLFDGLRSRFSDVPIGA